MNKILRLSRLSFWDILAVVLLGVMAWFYGHMVDNTQMGFTHDDGVYAISAKALAQGKGLTLLHVVGQPSEVKYPVFYPLLLAPVWWIQGTFPAVLSGFNGLNALLTLAACGVIYGYLTRSQRFPGWLALIVLALTTCSFFFLYFFTLVMSEGAYLLLSFLTLWYVHRQSARAAQASPDGVWPVSAVLTAVLLSLLTFHTRILGMALMAAIGAWLLLRRHWRNALIYGAGCFLGGVLPWMLWVRLRTPPVNDLNYPLVNAYSNYGLEFLHNYVDGNYLDGLRVAVMSLIGKLLESMLPIIPNFIKTFPAFKTNPDIVFWSQAAALVAMYALLGYFVLQLVRTLRQSGRDERFNADAFSIPALYLTAYIAAITLWNYEDQMARFLVVVTPLLWLYFFKPILAISSRGRKAALLVVVLLLSGFSAVATVPGYYRMLSIARREHWVASGSQRTWLWGEYENSFTWIRQSLPPDAPLGVASDVVYYLYTDHPTFYVFYASLKKRAGRFTPDAIPRLMRSLDHYGVRYLVAEPHMQFRSVRAPMNRIMRDLIDRFPGRFKLVYTTPRKAIRIYRIVPPF
jgi:hypothetical protein